MSDTPPDTAPHTAADTAPAGTIRARTRDRTTEVVAARRREIERGLAELVTPALVEEHRRQPIGRHSPALACVLAYFRQAPTAGKLVVHTRRPGATGAAPFGLLRLSGTAGVPHDAVPGERFATEDETLHAAFLLRLDEHGMGLDGHGMGSGGTGPAASSGGGDG